MCGHYYPVVPLPVLLAKPHSLITDRFVSLTRLRSVNRRGELLAWRRGLTLSSSTQFTKLSLFIPLPPSYTILFSVSFSPIFQQAINPRYCRKSGLKTTKSQSTVLSNT